MSETKPPEVPKPPEGYDSWLDFVVDDDGVAFGFPRAELVQLREEISAGRKLISILRLCWMRGNICPPVDERDRRLYEDAEAAYAKASRGNG